MGTTWSVQIAAALPRPEQLLGRIEAALNAVVDQMSHWEPTSQISRYNRAGAGAWLPVGRDFARVMDCALEIARLTDGAFDPALGEAAEAWGFGPARRASGLAATWRPGAWREIRLEDGALFQPGGARLDLSGIAKGYAVDKVAGVLAAEGVQGFLVDIGGEMYGRGLGPGGAPWWVAVEPPRAGAADEIVVALPGWALATSGDYRRYFEQDGRRFSHTLDPVSGTPVSGRVASVSVLAADCMRADAFATALTAMGETAGLTFADAHGLAALFLLAGEEGVQTRASAAWERLWA